VFHVLIFSQGVTDSDLVDAGMQSQSCSVIMKFFLVLYYSILSCLTISISSFSQICARAHGIVQHEVTIQDTQQACAHILSKIEFER
jgi:hypothetical protein